jgi:hypothetical protein
VRLATLTHEFVDSTPTELEEGTLYVSMRFRTVVHLCACGCKNKVVTPLRPAKWNLIFDGDTVSLSPSIGNWQFPCRSHYWIEKSKVRWAKPWTDDEIAAGRARDGEDVRRYYAERESERSPEASQVNTRDKKSNVFFRRWRRKRKQR